MDIADPRYEVLEQRRFPRPVNTDDRSPKIQCLPTRRQLLKVIVRTNPSNFTRRNEASRKRIGREAAQATVHVSQFCNAGTIVSFYQIATFL